MKCRSISALSLPGQVASLSLIVSQWLLGAQRKYLCLSIDNSPSLPRHNTPQHYVLRLPLFNMASTLSASSDEGSIKVEISPHHHQRHKYRKINGRGEVNKSMKSRTKMISPGAFQNDLFKLSSELRNQVYEYIIHGELQYEEQGRFRPVFPKKRNTGASNAQPRPEVWWLKPRHIRSGNDNEPALFEACRQVRSEALGIYYRLNAFIIDAKITQMASVDKWISSVRGRFEVPSQPTKLAFLDLGLWLRSAKWTELPALGALARLAQVHSDYFMVEPENSKLDFPDWEPHTPANIGMAHVHLSRVALDAVKLGNKAARKDWHEEWLSIKFEEWFKEKIAGNTGDKLARYRLGEKVTAGMKKSLPGGQLSNGVRDTEKSRAPGLVQCKKSRIGTSNRKLRSQE